MKLALMILILCISGAAITFILGFAIHYLVSLQSDFQCSDCTYYRKGYCKHWEEKRKPDQKTCDTFKFKTDE